MTDNTKTNYYHILDIPTRLLSDLIRSIKLNDTQRRALVGSLIWGQPVSGSKIRSIRLDDTQADALVGSPSGTPPRRSQTSSGSPRSRRSQR